MIFDCPERLRRAIKFRAIKTGLSTSEIIAKILEASLSKELVDADESLREGITETPRTRRGRKPKS